MAIGVKVLERPIEKTSYVRATLSGMALTLKHLFSEKVTVCAPLAAHRRISAAMISGSQMAGMGQGMKRPG